MAKILTVSDAAKQLGISRQRVAKLCKDGRISARRIGIGQGVYLIDPHSLLEYQRNPERRRAPVGAVPGTPQGSCPKKKK